MGEVKARTLKLPFSESEIQLWADDANFEKLSRWIAASSQANRYHLSHEQANFPIVVHSPSVQGSVSLPHSRPYYYTALAEAAVSNNNDQPSNKNIATPGRRTPRRFTPNNRGALRRQIVFERHSKTNDMADRKKGIVETESNPDHQSKQPVHDSEYSLFDRVMRSVDDEIIVSEHLLNEFQNK